MHINTAFSLTTIFVVLTTFRLNSQNTEGYPSLEFQKARVLPYIIKYEANNMVRDNNYFFNRYGIAHEAAVAKRVSVNTTIHLYRQSQLLFQDFLVELDKKATYKWSFAIEPRFYLSQNQNTFFGNYIGLRASHETGYKHHTYPISKLLFTFGAQRIFYTSTFNDINNAFDGKIGLGISYQKNKGIRPAFQINMLQGAVINDLFRKYDPSNAPPDRTEEYQALTNQKYHIKLDFFNLITHADENSIFGELRVAYEHKIAQSAFSLNIEGVISPSYLKNTLQGATNIAQVRGRRLGISIEPRWYYDLKKRISNRRSGNNLLGSYLSLEGLYQNLSLIKQGFNTSDETYYQPQSLTLTPLWGIQQQFSKHIFYDFKLGWGIRTVQDSNNAYFKNYESNIYADILIGLRFGK